MSTLLNPLCLLAAAPPNPPHQRVPTVSAARHMLPTCSSPQGPANGLESNVSDVCLVQVSNYRVGDDHLAGEALGSVGARQSADRPSADSFAPKTLADASMYAWSFYALRHGYHYVRVIETEAGSKPDENWQEQKCSISWCKGAAVQRLLPQCKLLALLDIDVIMVDWGTPLEDLLHMWNFTGELNRTRVDL